MTAVQASGVGYLFVAAFLAVVLTRFVEAPFDDDAKGGAAFVALLISVALLGFGYSGITNALTTVEPVECEPAHE